MRRIDPLAYLAGIAALIVYAQHGFAGFLQRDLAIYAYAGQQVVEGTPPYLGILSRTGPLAQLLPAIGVAGARAGGFDDLLGARLLFMMIAVACVSVVYALARDLFTSRLAGIAAAAAFLTFYGFIEMATYGPREKTPMVLFLLFTLLAVVKRRWFASGITLALATLVWQPAFLVGLAAAMATVVALRRAERMPALARLAAGGLATTAVCIVYFVAVRALREFLDAFLLINARYTVPDPLLGELPEKWALLQKGYGISLWVMLLGLAAVAILTVLAVRRRGVKAAVSNPVVAVGAASFTAIAWSVRDFNSWPDAFVLLPLAAIGIGGIAKELTERLPARAALSLVLVWMVAGGAIALTYSTTQRDDLLVRQRDAVEKMLERLPANASILSIGAPQPLVLSGRTNPTRYQTFTRGLARYVDDTWPGGLRSFAEWVGREKPTIISLGSRQVPLWLSDTIDAEYRRAGRAPGWVWYVHRSAELDFRSARRSRDRSSVRSLGRQSI